MISIVNVFFTLYGYVDDTKKRSALKIMEPLVKLVLDAGYVVVRHSFLFGSLYKPETSNRSMCRA